MPDFPPALDAPRIQNTVFTVSLLASGGDGASVVLSDLDVAVTGLELAAVRTAVGNLSNAAVWNTSLSGKVTIAKTLINPLDEAYASASEKLVLVFQDADLNLRQIAIPAPDEAYFGGDGVTMITPNGSALNGTPARTLSDAITAILVALNGGGSGTGTFALLQGYRSSHTRKVRKPKIVRGSVEPAVGQLPSGDPD